MKKLIFLMALAVGVLLTNETKAQDVISMPTIAGDTLNASVLSISKTFSMTGAYKGTIITPIVTKIGSGTVAATCVLYESIDNAGYKTTTDTLGSISATTRVNWHKAAPLNHYYKVTCTHTDTSGRAIVQLKYQPVK